MYLRVNNSRINPLRTYILFHKSNGRKNKLFSTKEILPSIFPTHSSEKRGLCLMKCSMANFEAFCQGKNFSKNILFLRSEYLVFFLHDVEKTRVKSLDFSYSHAKCSKLKFWLDKLSCWIFSLIQLVK